MIAVFWFEGEILGAMPIGEAIGDWSKERQLSWAEALVSVMPVGEDCDEVTVVWLEDCLKVVRL